MTQGERWMAKYNDDKFPVNAVLQHSRRLRTFAVVCKFTVKAVLHTS